MKAKMIAVAVAGMLVGCGSGGGSVEFQSQKGEPEVLVVDEYKGGVNGDSTVQQDNPEYLHQKGESLVQEALPEGGAEKGTSLVQQEKPTIDEGKLGTVYQKEDKPEFVGGVNGEGTIHDIQEFDDSNVGTVHNPPEADYGVNGEPEIHQKEHGIICSAEEFEEGGYNCGAAVLAMGIGFTEAHNEYHQNRVKYRIEAEGLVHSIETYYLRSTKHKPSYADVIKKLTEACTNTDGPADVYTEYTCKANAVVKYYIARGIPEEQREIESDGACADFGWCAHRFNQYVWGE